jgi:GntR family transcriptional regulator of vanillate catabolism
MIIGGELSAGQKLVELSLAERLEMSRTPVRYALGILEREGLLSRSPTGTFVVNSFSLKQIDDAMEVRGALEGLAARLAAERGASRALIARLRECLAISERLTSGADLQTADLADYGDMNARFHRLIVEAADNEALSRMLQINASSGFGAADAIFFEPVPAPRRLRRLHYAHFQHEAIVEAIEAGEGARAEALMREHAMVGAVSRRLPRRMGAAEAVSGAID